MQKQLHRTAVLLATSKCNQLFYVKTNWKHPELPQIPMYANFNGDRLKGIKVEVMQRHRGFDM